MRGLNWGLGFWPLQTKRTRPRRRSCLHRGDQQDLPDALLFRPGLVLLCLVNWKQGFVDQRERGYGKVKDEKRGNMGTPNASKAIALCSFLQVHFLRVIVVFFHFVQGKKWMIIYHGNIMNSPGGTLKRSTGAVTHVFEVDKQDWLAKTSPNARRSTTGNVKMMLEKMSTWNKESQDAKPNQLILKEQH